MVPARELGERKAAILDALIRHYIRTGEPVASDAIAAAAGLGVSSATIRHELASLEELGYLAQPHTSAGRVPTDLGYRYYVDMLPPHPRLRDAERRAIVHFFDEALADVDEILRGTTHLLSNLTRYASLAIAPSLRESTVVRSELIDLGATTLMLLVFDTGGVEKRIIDLPEGAREGNVLERVSRIMTEELEGKSVSTGRSAAQTRAATLQEPDRDVLLRVVDAMASLEEAAEAEHVFFGGAANIAIEGSFRRRETLRQILEALERESEILRLLREAALAPPVTVTIGRENPVTGIWEASMVAAPYGAGGRAVGTIGVVGPTRMDYATAISAVRAVADRLSAAVEALGA
jgi:heat-inducible transcriptional repressor